MSLCFRFVSCAISHHCLSVKPFSSAMCSSVSRAGVWRWLWRNPWLLTARAKGRDAVTAHRQKMPSAGMEPLGASRGNCQISLPRSSPPAALGKPGCDFPCGDAWPEGGSRGEFRPNEKSGAPLGVGTLCYPLVCETELVWIGLVEIVRKGARMGKRSELGGECLGDTQIC